MISNVFSFNHTKYLMCLLIILSMMLFSCTLLLIKLYKGNVCIYPISLSWRYTRCTSFNLSPVGWGLRIHQLHLCRMARLPFNECPGYDIKQSDDEAPVMLELWEMWSTPSLPLLAGPLRPGVVAPNRILSMGQIEQTVCKQMTDVKLWLLYCNTWNHLTVCKKNSGSFKNFIYKMCLQILYI